MTHTNLQDLSSAFMVTPFLAQPKEISKKKSNQLLRKGSWKSYRYSRDTHKYQPLSREERDNRNPDHDYIHFREDSPSDNSKIISQTSSAPLQEKSSTQSSPPERTQPSFYENAIIESKGKIYTGRASVVPTTALSIQPQKTSDSEKTPKPKADSEKNPKPKENPAVSEIRTIESVNPIETFVGKPNTLSCADLNSKTESQTLCIECLSNHSEQKAIENFSSSFEDKFTANNVLR